jgi:hypothetical protein
MSQTSEHGWRLHFLHSNPQNRVPCYQDFPTKAEAELAKAQMVAQYGGDDFAATVTQKPTIERWRGLSTGARTRLGYRLPV